MKKIALPNGMVGMIDDADFEAVSKFKWHSSPSAGSFYMKRHGEAGKRVYLHRQLMNPPQGQYVDHIDGNGLNNQRANLRICTPTENARHVRRKPAHGFHSKYIGVSYSIRQKKWSARAAINRKGIHLGWFDTEDEAAIARNAYIEKTYGAFAHLNEVPK